MTTKTWIWLILLLFITFLVYLNSFSGVFQFDDYNVIVDNPRVHSFSAWLSDLSSGLRPGLKLTYTLNWVSGLGIFGFHLLNLLIHLANAILIFFLSLRFTRRYETAFLASLLFAIHPVQTESVTYICGRSTSLMAFFYLGSILTYICSERKILLYFVSPSLFVMAVLVKETAVTLPFALFLLDRQGLRQAMKKEVVHWMLLLVILFVLIIHPNYGQLLAYSFKIRSIEENFLSQINGITYLLSRLIAVDGLNIDPDLRTISTWTPLLVAKLSLLLSLLFISLIKIRSKPEISFGILWFFLHLTPTNSIVPRLDIANERQLYLAIWGVFLILSIGVERLAGQKVFWAGIIVLGVIFGYFTLARNEVYRSEIALWEDTSRKSEGKPRAYNNLGYAYTIAGRYEEAERAYLKALEIKPDYRLARNNLNRLLIDMKRKAEKR